MLALDMAPNYKTFVDQNQAIGLLAVASCHVDSHLTPLGKANGMPRMGLLLGSSRTWGTHGYCLSTLNCSGFYEQGRAEAMDVEAVFNQLDIVSGYPVCPCPSKMGLPRALLSGVVC